jgi:hypothetical protein
MPDPNLPLLEDAARKLAAFLEEIVFVGGVTLGLLITDEVTFLRGWINSLSFAASATNRGWLSSRVSIWGRSSLDQVMRP